MSEAEDVPTVAEDGESQGIIGENISKKSYSAENLNTRVDILEKSVQKQIGTDEKIKEEIKNKEEEREEEEKRSKEEEEAEKPREEQKNRTETGCDKEEATKSASLTNTTSTSTVDETDGTFDKKSSSNDRREDNKSRVGAPATVSAENKRCTGNEITAVGEWNSLPILVERLRAALELSLTTGNPRKNDPPMLPEDSGIDSEEDLRTRNSMEYALECNEPQLKKDIKFLEDILLSDIQTALSRLRETLERTDIVALAKHGAASDPSSKLHLLQLVASLLSRLQLSEEETPSKTKGLILPTTGSTMRRRRATRHTIGVSAEELASARRWLEEERNNLTSGELPVLTNQETQKPASFLDGASNGISTVTDRRVEEIRDKCIKDAINQRQSLRDKNKETRTENSVYHGMLAQNASLELGETEPNQLSNIHRGQFRFNLKEYCDRQSSEIENTVGREGHYEERNRVSKLAAALRQRAELSTSTEKYTSNNKFTAKKSKIKRANTIDIPSYLKLQAESLGHDNSGCVSLRRPINVGDRTGSNASNLIVPSFQPKTENDRKFLALISKNNDAPSTNSPQPFKTFGYNKTTDLSSLTNEHWNSRFSNIKTTFDKPSMTEERGNKPCPNVRVCKRFPSFSRQPFEYDSTTQRQFNKDSYNKSPTIKIDSKNAGFQHAPSSPFRKIEKPSTNVSCTKVPLTYHWSKNNARIPTNTLREKAKMLFDRENISSQQFSTPKPEELYEKSTFPRPPWIGRDKNDVKTDGSITENGRLDYRLFCKQFAPFVGKGAYIESEKNPEFGGVREREYVVQCRQPTSYDGNTGVLDGKISFKMIPDKHTQVHQYPAINQRHDVKQLPQEKFGSNVAKNTLKVVPTKSGSNYVYSGVELPEAYDFIDANLHDSSSVVVQTGLNDERSDKSHSFHVAPKILEHPSFVYSDTCVQTCNELDRTVASVTNTKSGNQRKSSCSDRPDTNRKANSDCQPDHFHRFILDHNQNYHAVTGDRDLTDCHLTSARHDSQQDIKDGFCLSGSMNESTFQPIVNYHLSGQTTHPMKKDPRLKMESNKHVKEDRKSVQSDRPPSFTAPILENYNRSEGETPNSVHEKGETDWPIEDSSFLGDENIQNQDISPDIGVVTRYTCAIATVESNDSPDLHSEELAINSRTSSSPSPSQSLSWSRSRPATNDTATPEDEIRRHNILQQNLVRRLQNERTSLNDSPGLDSVSTSFNQPINVPRPSNFNEPANFDLSPNISQPINFGPTLNFTKKYHDSSVNLPPKFLSPDLPWKQELSPTIAPSSSGSNTVNRVVALREAYEQTPSNQLKPIRKERSPIPNGATPIDSSDEYLVSCATKPSRSIVLSKSESWHQLALSNNYPRAPRLNVASDKSSSRLTCLPKPPKSRSPSFQKLGSKQFEASSTADSVKKMEDKIRRYFDSPSVDGIITERDASRSKRSSSRTTARGLIELSRSRTMPGLSDGKLHLMIPVPQTPLLNVNTADVDKVFDDLFEEATRTDGHQC